jgi:hypothetical protein
LQAGRSSRISLAALGLALAAAASAAWGQQPEAPATEVPLEKLFQLPESVATTPSSQPRRGGRTRSEWQSRFEQAEAELAKAKQDLEASRKELEEVAPDQAWSMSAPGLPVQSSPAETSIDYRLRQQIRKQREDLERAEHRIDELVVEANLAGVPEEWRERAAEPESEPSIAR